MNPWHYDPASDLDQSLFERLRSFPREPDMLVYGLRLAAALLCRGWLRLYHRVSITGRQHLPAEGSFVLVANHASHLDTLCLLAVLPLARLHRTFPAAAQDYFFVNLPRLLLASVVINALPFDRQANPRHSLSLCRRLLDSGANALILFPEGTRSPTGALKEFKPGVGLLAAGTDYPVVPCYLDGTHRALPKGSWFPRPGKVRVIIGPPRQYSPLQRDKESAVRISAELREAVLALAEGEADFLNGSLRQEASHDRSP
jgi:1-acyl-sn-glycerol-3-phosphate acyltransferase